MSNHYMFLIKYAEIAIKGKNRHLFEDALCKQIRHAIKNYGITGSVSKQPGRIYLETEDAETYDDDKVCEALQHVFGITAICPVKQIPVMEFDEMTGEVIRYMEETYGKDCELSFKVFARRIKRTYPIDSQTMNATLGEKILDAFPAMHVDVVNPQIPLHVEVREKVINIYSLEIPGPGGMPVGSNGKSMLLLSGGIDSPVAGYMIAKRGVKIDAVYFHAPPYTSERAKQKVVDLACQVAKYAGPIPLYVVNFTDIQMYIYEQCPHEELTIIMRRYMMRIAQQIAENSGCLGLITGESIGQVASQTIASLSVTNEVCTMPVFRPLIGFDKQEIIEIANKIGTFETSILPYEDCCTIFVAKHPVTKPSAKVIRASERHLEEKIDEMVKTAIESAEMIWCK